VLVAHRADHRVEEPDDADPARGQLFADGVDEERRVIGARLDDRTGGLISVALAGRVEYPDVELLGATGVGERERRADEPVELLDAESLEVVVGETPCESPREREKRVSALGRAVGFDAREERLEDGMDRGRRLRGVRQRLCHDSCIMSGRGTRRSGRSAHRRSPIATVPRTPAAVSVHGT
jgi:hypothetical protein